MQKLKTQNHNGDRNKITKRNKKQKKTMDGN